MPVAKWKPLSAAQFGALAPKITAVLTHELEKERTDTALPKFGGPSGSDLWELPPVDSKSVAKLSPFVKELVGRRLDPRWIRKGGYSTVSEAVDHMLVQLHKHCVVEGSSTASAESVALALTA
jgi:hypothetical protein